MNTAKTFVSSSRIILNCKLANFWGFILCETQRHSADLESKQVEDKQLSCKFLNKILSYTNQFVTVIQEIGVFFCLNKRYQRECCLSYYLNNRFRSVEGRYYFNSTFSCVTFVSFFLLLSVVWYRLLEGLRTLNERCLECEKIRGEIKEKFWA